MYFSCDIKVCWGLGLIIFMYLYLFICEWCGGWGGWFWFGSWVWWGWGGGSDVVDGRLWLTWRFRFGFERWYSGLNFWGFWLLYVGLYYWFIINNIYIIFVKVVLKDEFDVL